MTLNPHSLKLSHTAEFRKQRSSAFQLLYDSDCCYLGEHVQVTLKTCMENNETAASK